MFDIVVEGKNTTEYVPYTKKIVVNEHRAPTDESIKLYEEIKEKAYKSILDSIKIDSNSLKITAMLYDDLLSYKRILEYKFTLNDKKYHNKVEVDYYKVVSRGELIPILVEKVSNQIAVEIVKLVI